MKTLCRSRDLKTSEIVAPKLTDIWYKFLKLYGITPNEIFRGSYYSYNIRRPLRSKIRYCSADEYFLDLGNYEHYDILPSAYNFLLANKETYPEWVFTPLAKINRFGI